MLADDADPPDGLRHARARRSCSAAAPGEVATRNVEAMRAALVEHGEPYDVLNPSDMEGLAPEPGARSGDSALA
jgi:hypothetical protein